MGKGALHHDAFSMPSNLTTVCTSMADTVFGPSPKPYNEAETLASFDSVPLFMKSLPEETAEDSSLAALQSLVYDGTPDGRWHITRQILVPDLY